MTRSKALLFLLSASMLMMLIASGLLWGGFNSGWAFFVVGVFCLVSYVASIGIDIYTSFLQTRSTNQQDEFDI